METYQTAISTARDEAAQYAVSTEEAASVYKNNLLLTQEQLEKWPELERVQAWIDQHLAVFDAAEYGDSLAAVAAKLDEYDTFATTFVAQEQVHH